MLLSKSSKPALIAIALIYVFLILFIPAIAVFYEAFHLGFSPFISAISSRELLSAI